MKGIQSDYKSFDIKLVTECARAYSTFSGLGCTVSDTNGQIILETGKSCARCEICALVGREKLGCTVAHAYGMTEAERFGGKYIYFCPMGMTCFVSPIMDNGTSIAKITVGPFLMVEREDYIAFDLQEKLRLNDEDIARVVAAVEDVPYVSSSKVNSLSILLFMAVGFINNVSASNRMLEIQDSDAIQGQIGDYILELKSGDKNYDYPIKTEKELIASIAEYDKPKAQKLLNELLGQILFSSGGDFSKIRSRIYELLVIISRAAIDAGASPDQTFNINHIFFTKAQSTKNIDELCLLLTEFMNRYIDSLFDFADVKNADVIRKAVHYMRRCCTEKVSLDDVAKVVYLSPTYFSKMFKSEMGCSFNTYLNRLRVEKSKHLLLQADLRLADIACMSGFEDQSYFTKVFKRVTGVSPHYFRTSAGRHSGHK